MLYMPKNEHSKAMYHKQSISRLIYSYYKSKHKKNPEANKIINSIHLKVISSYELHDIIDIDIINNKRTQSQH